MQLVLQAQIAPPQPWIDPINDPLDCRSIANIEVQVSGVPSTGYAPVRSLDGKTYFPCLVFDTRYNDTTAITAEGIYSVPGGGFLKFSAGAGSTVTVRGSNT